MHGGSVSAHSDGIGWGSAFEVRLPLDDEGPASVEERRRACPGNVQRRVLVVEDNLDVAIALRDALEVADHQAFVARSGPEALVRAREARPDVVLCDIGLPGMDGFEVARAMRADAALSKTFLVAVSGYAQPRDVQRALEAGFDRHLAKPVSLDVLEEVLSSLSLDSRAPRARAPAFG
jgi:CheY-like chemotaxis protein